MHIFNLQFTQLQVVPKVQKISYESLSNYNYKENNTSLVSRSIFFDLTDLDRPRAQPTRPGSTFDLKIDLD